MWQPCRISAASIRACGTSAFVQELPELGFVVEEDVE